MKLLHTLFDSRFIFCCTFFCKGLQFMPYNSAHAERRWTLWHFLSRPFISLSRSIQYLELKRQSFSKFEIDCKHLKPIICVSGFKVDFHHFSPNHFELVISNQKKKWHAIILSSQIILIINLTEMNEAQMWRVQWLPRIGAIDCEPFYQWAQVLAQSRQLILIFVTQLSIGWKMKMEQR